MSARHTIKVQQGEITSITHYPERDQTLRENAELQKADAVRPTEGLRPFARFPEGELERLGRSNPDLVSKDAEIRSRAIKKLVNSSDGKCYRVGGTNRKTFRMRNNPLAKDR